MMLSVSLSLLICYWCIVEFCWREYGPCLVCDFGSNDDDDDDDISPEDKAIREKVRRQQNNARER